jgi:glycosyltransferase involved in cell wall biosynthesis
MARDASKVITVSDGIALEMAQRLKIDSPLVVRNVPERVKVNDRIDLRRILGIPNEGIIIIYIGGILANRGVETFIEAFSSLEREDVYLVFLGAECLPLWINLDISENVLNRIKFHPPIPPRDVVAAAASADIGIHAIRDTSLSHRYCLPNKLFEYIQAGLAVIVTDLPEMSAMVMSYGVGKVFPDGDESALTEVIESLCGDSVLMDKMKLASRNAKEDLCWEKEQDRLLRMYNALFAERG